MSSKVAFLKRGLDEVEKNSFLAVSKEAILRDDNINYFFSVNEGVIQKHEITNTFYRSHSLMA